MEQRASRAGSPAANAAAVTLASPAWSLSILISSHNAGHAGSRPFTIKLRRHAIIARGTAKNALVRIAVRSAWRGIR